MEMFMKKHGLDDDIGNGFDPGMMVLVMEIVIMITFGYRSQWL